MTVLHATEAPSVHLALAARVDGLTVADIEAALYEHRSLVKQLAMRRTLFVFPAELLPAAWGSASARVAGQELRKTVKDVAASGINDPERWLEEACAEVLAAVAASGGLTTAGVKQAVPRVAGTVSVSPGSKWGGDVPIAPRVLTVLGAQGRILRGHNQGHWRISRHAWTPAGEWLEGVPTPLSEQEGYAELVRRWLRTFGPGTVRDVQWWLGSTLTAARSALVDVGAVEVALDGGGSGWVLPDDLDPVTDVEPWAALLPVLDPTTMGWKDRDFYLDPEDTAYLFDSNGNGGTTAWWNGRIVGCWTQDEAGTVQVIPRGDLPSEAERALDVEAQRLTAWLDGVRISSVYASQQMKSMQLP